MNIQNTDSYEYRKLIGQIKFSFIAPVVSRTFIDDSISAYFKRVSETEIDWPDGTKRRFSDQTMKWWLHVYRKYGFEGLMPKDIHVMAMKLIPVIHFIFTIKTAHT